jgi:hypothetical protein
MLWSSSITAIVAIDFTGFARLARQLFFKKVSGANATPRKKERDDLTKISKRCEFATRQLI